MSYGAGHIADMVRRMKQNAALKSSRRSNKGRDRTRRSGKTSLKFPKSSKERVERVKREYGSRNRNYFFFITFFLIALFISLLLFSLYIMN